MQIQREKFFALTATLAGFWPNAGCVINVGGGTASAGTTTTTSTSTSATTSTTGTSEGETAGTEATTTGTSTTGTPTTGAPTSGSTTGGTGDCCTVQDTPGCGDPAVEACVCDEDPFCCGLEGGSWDETCVSNVNTLGCGACDLPDTGSTT
jgi:hypothetical protein